MSQSLEQPLVMVETVAKLKSMLDEIASFPVIAIDTESNSLYAYQEHVCLIQVSSPDTDYIVDALSVDDLAGLGAVFANPAQEKVLHGADYDVGTLRRDYGFEFSNIFDTMIASRVLGVSRYSLANLLEERFQVHLNKRMQKYDWGRRPLDGEALEYARLDTHYLIDLRDQILGELREKRREREAREAFERVAQSIWNRKPFDPDDFWKIKGANTLGSEELGMLKALFLLREEQAQRLDRPPFKVLNNRVLIEICQRGPEQVGDLRGITGLSERQIRHMGRHIVQAAQAGRQDPQTRADRPARRTSRPDDDIAERYEQLREWRKECAAARGVEPDVIVSNSLLWEIARVAPASMQALARLDGIGEYQIETYGKALITAVQR
jgi:ribonuclease D